MYKGIGCVRWVLHTVCGFRVVCRGGVIEWICAVFARGDQGKGLHTADERNVNVSTPKYTKQTPIHSTCGSNVRIWCTQL